MNDSHISTKRHCCFYQGVSTASFHILRELQVCKEQLTVRANSLSSFSVEKDEKKIWAHLESANSQWKQNVPHMSKCSQCAWDFSGEPLLLTLTIKQDTLLTVDTASCHY